jgi:diaminohydroxyphosphoribosylaminopyrimidine deaminase/5-amino-6-(5-phosphoribosylamino)uracil reductase
MDESDRYWMTRALELAERGRGLVEPNPLVGAVIVRDGSKVGEGWHQRFGQAHAEVNALTEAGEAACGATLFVTLEPCCHHGKTPPCTDAVIRAGIRRVVTAMTDPFPRVGGKGNDQLRAAGFTVEVGLCEGEARRLNAPYLKLLKTGRPYVHAKWAMTLDGKIATRTGDSKWISDSASRRRVHALRGRVDGIVVGIGTVLADDPLLTARPAGPRIATRIVLDSRGRLPTSCQLARTAREAPTLIITARETSEAKTESLRAFGCEVQPLPSARGRPELDALLDELGKRRMTNLLVEGGAEVLGAFLDARAIDEVHVYIAPLLAGGTQARTAIEGTGVERIADALRLTEWEVERIEGDLVVRGRIAAGRDDTAPVTE